jgi:hypothetical protein
MQALHRESLPSLARAMGSAKVDVIGPFGKRLSVARCATMRNIDDAESQFISLSAWGPLLPSPASVGTAAIRAKAATHGVTAAPTSGGSELLAWRS